MADIHVLTVDENGVATLVFHIPIPNSNNDVGVNYRTALVRSGLGGTTALPDGDGTGGTISAAEKTSVLAGSVYEHKVTFPLYTGGTSNAQLQTTIRQLYASENTRMIAKMGRVLKYFGHVESAS